MSNASKSLSKEAATTYRQAGVDIAAGDALARWIAQRAPRRPEVVGGIGAFAGLCALPSGMREPLLVAGTDGVGTKLKVAISAGRHGGVGIDLVAMCVNDIITVGAMPLFFLDYFATGKLDHQQAQSVLSGIIDGCKQAECALLGGETAEMPGMYGGSDYDLAGFAVGVVERDQVIDGKRIAAGDAVIGLSSSGLHSNGFSLVRRALALDQPGFDFSQIDEALGESWAEALLRPTRIYVGAVAALQRAGIDLRGIVHVTGGGLLDNPPRILADDLAIRFDRASWSVPPIIAAVAKRAKLDLIESHRTFNMGLGLLCVVPEAEVAAALEVLGEGAVVGCVIPRVDEAVVL
ncbi:MAG: phosphoribosylformylglycinamidine cyclo-ligase [Deltaproteobacteria bacterium]|nr:phosphoribosylformylglycinamidine cyclo-ligase [Deltaproteobacteria bacterium]